MSEQEIADAKAMIGRDGIGCEPGSATTVAGIKKLVAAGTFGADEDVVAVLTGHMLKDPDYVSQYHRGTLSHRFRRERRIAAPQAIHGAFPNTPERVAANKAADNRGDWTSVASGRFASDFSANLNDLLPAKFV